MKLSKFMKTLLHLALQKNEVEKPLLPWAILISKKERQLFYSKSNVNFKFLCLVVIYLANDNKQSLDLNRRSMSSTNLLYIYNRFKIWKKFTKPKFFIMM